MGIEYIIIILVALVLMCCMCLHKSEYFSKETPIASDYINDNVKIFIINLLNRPIKKQYMIDQLTSCNLNYNVFEAVDGTKLSIDSLLDNNITDQSKSMIYMKRPMRRGEVGCALSHIFIWNGLLSDDKYKYYLIFEDDAIIPDDFKDKLEVILKDVEGKDWDILYLNDNCHGHFKKQCDGDDYSDTTILPFRAGYGLYGYIINKKFADKCINNLHKDGIPSIFPLYMPVDDYLDFKSRSKTLTCIRSKEIIVEVNRKFDSDTTKIK
jgi:GR25 family glycosyltransferase involved in LPS biosynthesis